MMSRYLYLHLTRHGNCLRAAATASISTFTSDLLTIGSGTKKVAFLSVAVLQMVHFLRSARSLHYCEILVENCCSASGTGGMALDLDAASHAREDRQAAEVAINGQVFIRVVPSDNDCNQGSSGRMETYVL
jgi:hypothetical protein